MTKESETREELKSRIGEIVHAQIALVCDRDKIDLDEDQRAEIACVAAHDIIRFLDERREWEWRKRENIRNLS